MTSTVFQATGVAIDGRGLLLTGEPGTGKTSLALALIDRGATLIGDDSISLTISGDRLIASPPPHISGKIEIRNVGIAKLPVTSAPVGLLLKLANQAERLPDSPSEIELLGISIPELDFVPGPIAPAIRAEYAMRMHGLSWAGA